MWAYSPSGPTRPSHSYTSLTVFAIPLFHYLYTTPGSWDLVHRDLEMSTLSMAFAYSG
jgi:hypothetical protein